VPVTVKVAVKLPEEVEGVNVASAGSAFWVQVPSPPPPDQSAEVNVPPAEAPVMAIGAKGVPSQRLISELASAVGVCPQEIVLVSVASVPVHP
jgi:hypothetical protein